MAKKRILFVDDDRTWQEFAEIFLGKQFNLSFAENGLVAIKKIQEKKFDLVITDTEMPIMNGKELIKIIQENFSGLSVIMISSLSTYGKWAQKREIKFISKGRFGELSKEVKNFFQA